MKIDEILQLTEGRRLEFKKTLPSKADLAKTIVAFANDAGGELFIGVRDTPRAIMGLPEDRLVALEEQISNIIFTRCYPTIIPDISFVTYEDKHIIKVSVFRGSTPPYFLKKPGKNNGTFIRVGSTNRKADHTIIEELERKKEMCLLMLNRFLTSQYKIWTLQALSQCFLIKQEKQYLHQH